MSAPELPREAPHRVADGVLDSLGGVPTGVSETLSSALDKLPLKEKGPHRIIDSLLKGVVSGAQTAGEGLATGLDKPVEGIRR